MKSVFGIFIWLILLSITSNGQDFILSKTSIMPLDNGDALDVSEDGHYALIRDSRSFIIVYDLFANRSLFVIESSFDKNWLRNAVFDKSNCSRIFLYYATKFSRGVCYRLDIKGSELQTAELLLLQAGKMDDNHFRLKSYKDLLVFEMQRSYPSGAREFLFYDPDKLKPVNALNKFASEMLRDSIVMKYIVDEEHKQVYLVEHIAKNNGDLNGRIFKYDYTKDLLQKRPLFSARIWNANGSANNGARRGAPFESCSYLTKDGAYILTVTYKQRKGVSMYDREIAFAQLLIINTNTGVEKKVMLNGTAVLSSVDSLVDSLGGIGTNQVFQGYHGEIDEYLFGPDRIEMPEEFLLFTADDDRVMGVSKLRASRTISVVRNNNMGILYGSLRSVQPNEMFCVDYPRRTIVKINTEVTDQLAKDGYYRPDVRSFESHRLIKDTPFDIVKPPIAGGYYSVPCLDKANSYAQPFGPITMELRQFGMDAATWICGTGIISLRKGEVNAKVSALHLLDAVDTFFHQGKLKELNTSLQVRLQNLSYPIIEVVISSWKSGVVLFSWDLRQQKIVDGWSFRDSNAPGISGVFAPEDSVTIFVDIAKGKPDQNKALSKDTIELLQYHHSSGIIFRLDTFQLSKRSIVMQSPYYDNDHSYYKEANLAILKLSNYNNGFILYDLASRRKLFQDQPIDTNGLNSRNSVVQKMLLTVSRHLERYASKEVIELPLLSSVVGWNARDGGSPFCVVDRNARTIMLTMNRQVVRYQYTENDLKVLNEYEVEGRVCNINCADHYLVSVASQNDNLYNIYNLDSGKYLMEVSFTNNAILFTDSSGQSAQFNSSDDNDDATNPYLNRPDAVIHTLFGNDNTHLQYIYKRVVALRQQKASNSQAEKDKPVLFCQKKPAQISTTDSVASFVFGSDNIISAYNVWVNGVPLYGTRGTRSFQKGYQLDLNIALSQDQNMIEVAVAGTTGVWSDKFKFLCQYKPPKKTAARTYFIGIGMSDYEDASRKLNVSDDDIIDVSSKLAEICPSFVIVDTLINYQRSLRQRLAEIRKVLLNTGPNDKIIFMMSGHGLLSSNQLQWYFAGYHTDFSAPDTSTALTYDDINSLFENVPARSRLVIIDACHAGQSYFDYSPYGITPVALTADSSTVLRGKKNDRDPDLPLAMVGGFSAFIPARNFENIDYQAFKIITASFPDYLRNGLTIITASRGEQTAKEDKKNGIFTQALLSVFDQHKSSALKVSQLMIELDQKFIHADSQQPSLKAFNPSLDWKIW